MSTNLRLRVQLLIGVVIVCSVAYTYLHTHIGIRSGTHVKTASNTAAERGMVKIISTGNFTDRMAAFNTFLSALRFKELARRRNDTWQGATASRLDVVPGARDDYLQLLSNYTNVLTVALPWLTNNPRTWSSL